MKKIQKTFFAISFTLFVMAAGFAADFTWLGISATWKDQNNWIRSGSIPPSHPGYPSTSSDTAIIISNGQAPVLNTSIPINLNSLKINSGSLNITGNTSLTLSGNFTHNGGTFSAGPNTTVTFNGSNSKITGTGSSEPLFGNLTVAANPAKLELEKNIKIAGTFTKNGGFYANNNTTVTFTNSTSTITAPVNSEPTFWNLTIAGSAGLQLGSNIKVAGTFTNNGSFTHNGKAVTFVGFGSEITGTATETEFSTLAIDKRELPAPPPYNKVTLADGKKIKIKVFKNIYKGTFNAGSGTEITVTEEFDNTDGTFEPKTSTVKLIPSGNTVTITGTGNATDTKFYKLKLINGGNKTLKIKNKISVAEKGLELEGGTASPPSKDPLTVSPESAGEINFYTPPTPITGTPPKGKYLTVEAGIPIAGGTYTVVQSKPQGTPSANWIFEDCLINMTWTGGNSTQNWNDYANWSPNGIPGIHTPVTIQTTSRYPKLTANVSAESVTVNSGAELDLTHYTIKKGPLTAKLTNDGTIKMTGSGDQLSWFSAGNADNITLGNTSTVEYYDAPPSNANIWAGPYENLKVSGTRQNLRALSITVNKDFTVASPSFAQAAGTFIFNGSSTIGGTGTISFYNLTVASSKSVTLNKDIAVGGAFINNNGATFNANDKNITFGGNFTNDGAFTPGSNTVTFNGSSTIGGSGAISFNNLSVASGKSVTLNKDITVGGAFINSSGATFNASTYNITLNSIFSNSGTFNSTDGTNNSFTFNGSFTNSGTFNANADNITFTGTTFTNSGTFAAGTNNTVILTNGADHTITGTGNAGNTKFHNLSLTGAGGKTLTINGKISVNGILKLEGTSAGSLLTIAGGTNSPGIKLSADQTGNGRWLNVHTNIPMIPESGGKTYTVTESKDHEVSGFLISDGHPKNWIFSSYAGPMTWKGNHSSNWSDWQNWRPYGIPGVKSDVTIPQKEAAAHYPKLTANVSAKSVTVNSGADLDLDGYLINTTGGTAKLINKGHLKLTGTAGQKNWFENANDANKMTVEANSIVEYYAGSADDIWAGPYENLKVSGGKTSFTTGNLIVNKAFTVDTTGSFTVNADSQNYKGAVELKKETTFKSDLPVGTIFENNLNTFGNSITFDGNGAIKTRDIMLALGSGTITVKEGTGGWTSIGQITVKDIIVKRNWTSTGNITASGDITADNTAHTNTWTSTFGDIKVKGNLTAARFNQTAGTLTFNGTGTPEQELKFTGAGNKNINHLAINSSAKVKLGSNITIQGNFTNSGTFDATTAPGYTITLTNGADHTITGNTAAGSIGTQNNTDFHNLVCINAGGKHIRFDKKISVHGNLTLQGSSINNVLNISGTNNNAEIYVKSNQGTALGYECKWLGVATNLPIKSLTSSTYTCTTDESKPTGNTNDIEAGKPENWIFTNVYELRWTGEANDNNWNNPNNWRPRTSHAPKPTQFATVRAVAAGNHPILGSGDYYAKKVEVVGTATLDLADKLIYSNTAKTATAELTAKGTLRLKGTDDQKTWFEHSNSSNRMTITQNSTVEYYSAPPTIKLWGGGTDGYNKLILNNIGTCTTQNSNLTVNGELTVKSSNVTINSGGGTQTYNGAINATGKDITLEGSTIATKHNITANKIKVLGDWNSNSGTITAGTDIEAAKWTSADGVITNAGNNITVTGAWDSKGSTITANNIEAKKNWDSSGNVTSNGNIKVDNGYLWKPTAGDIKLKGNLTAGKFNQTGGTLTFNGSTDQNLHFTGSGEKNIFNLIINTSAKVKLLSPVTIENNFTNKGTFDADTHTVKLSNNDHTVKNIGSANTKFSNLECTTSTTSKTLNISGKISVTGDLILSGANGEPLTINGSNSAEIHLSNSHDLDSSNNAKGNYLKIYTGNVKIRPEGKYYVVKNSKDDSGSTISKNGWIFYKDSLQIVNSFAKPNDNHIYLLFDDDSLSTEEFHSLKALSYSLQITDGVTTYTSNLQTVNKEPSSYIPSGHSLWKIQLDGTQKFNPDDILKSAYQVSLNYFGTLKHKAQISDIGIGMVEPLTASNSIVLRNFNAGDNDPALPTLDVRVLAEKAPSSSNVILHFFSKNSAEHKFWHPDTIPSPPGSFANPQAGTTNYSPTLNGNLITSIIPSTDPSLKEGKVGQFMYVYNNWLPCARLRNPNDILSFDVWNFKIVGVRMQKGGVSIFDNVVNPHKGQSATIAAHLKKSGMLTIQIMTLDGNIVRTLTRSHHSAGDHFYLWDGRNNGGNPVASGMYFVRIAGPDIDEVRKILIIK
ncbi:hypothetical protein HO345_11450 [Treponema denticola]|uniref:FlgD immunoglobulin-like domain containing protein n=1 Tax=Treponema denticola TaxID=158 RepID=UPI0020A4F4B6|nr:FlgD immunoglobulin-like domain containing protein [Treponema denticola]UTD13552.1 hypothetical protein HO345_11450 [Treponema denticola]